MKITIFGVGFVGLTHGAVLAKYGHDVCCVDVDIDKINNLENGRMPFFEPNLSDLVYLNKQNNSIKFTTDIELAIKHGEIIFIAVGTPSNQDGSADLSYVEDVTLKIGSYINEYKLVVIKSTAPIGTVDLIKDKIQKLITTRNIKCEFDVASNPEFLKQGSAVNDCLYPDRVIVGADSEKAKKYLKDLYSSLSIMADKIIFMKPRSAELTKYAANSMLAAKISMINEIANIAEKYGADIEEVRQGIGSDQRIGSGFISPGPGFGGSCFPKDVRALIKMCLQVDFEPLMLRAIENRNNVQKRLIFEKICSYFNGDLYGKVFALWGLAFKANTSDLRESSSHIIINELLKKGAVLKVYDPEAMIEAKNIYSLNTDIFFCNSKEEALFKTDGLIILTEWDEFKKLDWAALKSGIGKKIVFDARNLYSKDMMNRENIEYISIGR